MAKNDRRMTIAEAKQQAADWEIEWARSSRSAAIDSHFQHVGPSQVIEMWETQTNEQGRKLTQFEFEALVTRWYDLFRAYPPNGDEALNGSAADPATPQEVEPDTILSVRKVARQTGISTSTIKRMVKDGRFPKPLHLSPRRIGWKAHEVKIWVDQLDDQRRAPRQ